MASGVMMINVWSPEGVGGFGNRGGHTVLTIRVNKSQCQATADDRMTAAQLRERSVIHQY